jgi:hypothetical protein
MAYGTKLYSIGGAALSPLGAKTVGDSEYMWQDPSSIGVTMPKGWYTNDTAQKAGIGLGTVALAYLAWYLLYKKGK